MTRHQLDSIFFVIISVYQDIINIEHNKVIPTVGERFLIIFVRLLAGKVLVKGKRLPDDSHSDGEVSDEDEAADVEEEGKKKKEKTNKVIKAALVDTRYI